MVDLAVSEEVIGLARRRRLKKEDIIQRQERRTAASSIFELSAEVDSCETDGFANRLYCEHERALMAYLNALPPDDIRCLFILMYMGIDEFESKDSGPDVFRRLDKGFQDAYSPDVQRHQMVEKLPLDTFLENGLRKYGFPSRYHSIEPTAETGN